MEKINTALASFGMSGVVFHAPFIVAHPGFQLTGVFERSKELSKEKYPWVKIYRSFDELIADPEVDLVVVNTPNHTHFDFTKKALLAGKDVIVEKPFTTFTEEADELIQLAREKNRFLTVYHNRRYDSDFRTVKKVVAQKMLGDIVEAEIHYDRFKEELSPKVHKEIPSESTGSLYDLGSHLIDAALQLFGRPEALFADIHIVRPISKVYDYFDIVLYYPTLRVRVKSSYLVREALPGFILHGSKGSFLKNRSDVQEIALQAGKSPNEGGWGIESDLDRGLLHTVIDGQEIKEKLPSEVGNYLDFYDEVYQAIKSNSSAPVALEDARDVIKIIRAAYQSNEEKRLIPLSF
ncbi:MAG: Gfo/Idh/MocA family oxidoreductase [Chitinophagaceae bacterium]